MNRSTAASPSTGSDALIVGLVSTAHMASHFFQLALAPLFPRLHDAFAVSYIELGSLSACFYLCSGICQAMAGILVDRYGARRMLLAGVTLMAGCVGLAGLVTQFWMLYPLAALAGVGNSVFHPADLSLLSDRIGKQRLGRAFSMHAFMGMVGYAAAPIVMSGLATLFGWRVAVIAAGLAGLLVLALLVRFGEHLTSPAERRRAAAGKVGTVSYGKLVTSPAIMMAFGYFLLTNIGGTGFQTFSTAALVEAYQVPLATAAAALTVYLVGSAVGILIGGQIADRTGRHARVAATGLGACAVLMLGIALGGLPFAGVVALVGLAGLSQGITAPSRDVLVKSAAPAGASGKVFGFVYSGLDAGSTLAPMLFGALLDHQAYRAVFVCVAALFAAAIGSVLSVNRHRPAA